VKGDGEGVKNSRSRHDWGDEGGKIAFSETRDTVSTEQKKNWTSNKTERDKEKKHPCKKKRLRVPCNRDLDHRKTANEQKRRTRRVGAEDRARTGTQLKGPQVGGTARETWVRRRREVERLYGESRDDDRHKVKAIGLRNMGGPKDEK